MAAGQRQVFVDLDGVLADFDGHYEKLFGYRMDRERPKDSVQDRQMWKNIAGVPTFFRDLPVLRGAHELWNGLLRLCDPVVLTGGGTEKKHTTADQKREWVAEHISTSAKVIVTESKNKYQHGKPGDILIDDWKRYMPNWVNMGGIFILYKGDPADALKQVSRLVKDDGS